MRTACLLYVLGQTENYVQAIKLVASVATKGVTNKHTKKYCAQLCQISICCMLVLFLPPVFTDEMVLWSLSFLSSPAQN